MSRFSKILPKRKQLTIIFLYPTFAVADYLGIKIVHWISFFKAISETSTDIKIEERIQRIKARIIDETESEFPSEKQAMFLDILKRIEELWRQTNG